MKNILLPAFTLYFIAAIFFACDSGSSSSSSEEFEISAASVDELDSCTSKMQGETAYVKDEKAMYTCEGGKWTVCTDCDSSDTPSDAKKSSASKGADPDSHQGDDGKRKSDYVCEIYSLSDALECECDEEREDSLAYNYDSSVELVCIFDEYLNKWGWVENKKEDSGDEGEDLPSASKGESSGSAKGGSNNDKGGDEVKSSSSSKGESNLGYDYLWNSSREALQTACSSDEDQKGKKALSAYSDSCIYVCAFNDSLDRWMWHKIDGTCPEKVESSSSKEKSSSSSAKSSSSWIKMDYVPGNIPYSTFEDPRDHRVYKSLEITGVNEKKEKQTIVVMIENLNIGEMVEGGKDQSDDSKIERYCYNNDTLNCLNYGGLYEWAEMMQLPSECNTKSCADQIKPNHQGICPDGWHLLTYDEFYTVVKADGNDAGVKGTRAIGFGGYNYSGYSLIGAGWNRLYEFKGLGEVAYWHYPVESDTSKETRSLGSRQDPSSIYNPVGNFLKTLGCSVRCVMNK